MEKTYFFLRVYHKNQNLFSEVILSSFIYTSARIYEPVFAKTSPKRSFSVIENKRFGLVFAITGSINLETDLILDSREPLPVVMLLFYSTGPFWGPCLTNS